MRGIELLDHDDRLAFERLLQWLRLSFLASPVLVVGAFGAPAAPYAALIAAATLGSFALVEWLLRRAPRAVLAWQLGLRVLDCGLVLVVLLNYHAFLRDAYYDSVYVLFVCAAAATHGRRGALWLAPVAGAAVLAGRLAHVQQGYYAFHVRHVTDPIYYTIFFFVTGLAVAHLMERSARAAQRREEGFRAELAARNAALEQTAAARDEALRQAQGAMRVRDEFVSAASHDLKNPLTVIVGTIDALARSLRAGRFDPERASGRLARVTDAAQRMVAQLDELVAAAQAGAEPEPGRRREPTDLVDLVRRAVDAHGADGRRRLRVEVAADSLVGEWDAVGLSRVVDNLLSNAVKYSPAETEITVRVGREDGAAVLSVRDRGIGIPEGELERVFERSYRASNAGDRPGNGLGLAAARQIVEELGGRLTAASREGEGSEFTVTLPLRGVERADAPPRGATLDRP